MRIRKKQRKERPEAKSTPIIASSSSKKYVKSNILLDLKDIEIIDSIKLSLGQKHSDATKICRGAILLASKKRTQYIAKSIIKNDLMLKSEKRKTKVLTMGFRENDNNLLNDLVKKVNLEFENVNAKRNKVIRVGLEIARRMKPLNFHEQMMIAEEHSILGKFK